MSVKQKVCVIGGLGVLLGLLAFAKVDPVLYANTSASAPIGLYVSDDGSVEVGDYVVFETDQIWTPSSWGDWESRLLKRVVAVEGQHVRVWIHGVYVDHSWLGLETGKWVVLNDDITAGFNRVLGPGEVFVVSAIWNAFDSRYFGPVSLEACRRVRRIVGLL